MASAKDEIARRPATRRDPRAESDSVPAMPAVGAKPAVGPKPLVIEEVAPSVKRDSRADPDSIPAMPAVAQPEAHEEVALQVDERSSAPVPAAAAAATAVDAAATVAEPPVPVDPRLAELEPLFARTAWRDIAERLGPPDEAGALPPALALIYALAQREAAGEGSAAGATELAIKSMAELVGVAPSSATALVLAKRLLRQNPAGWRTKPAPPARLSVAIIVIGIVVGAGVGWFVSLGSFHLF